jgi:hypothetical protein
MMVAMECFSVDINDAAANTELLARLHNEPPPANDELLARLRNSNNPPPWFVGLTDEEFSARIAAMTEAIRVPWERGKQHTDDVDEPDDDELVKPVPPAAPPQQTLYKRARDLAWTVFPVSEAVILAAARKVNIGRKGGRTMMFSPDDLHRLYEEAFQPCSNSSAAPSRPSGTSAVPSGAAALKKARKLLMTDARPAKDKPKKSGRSARPRSSSKASTVVAFPKPSQERS